VEDEEEKKFQKMLEMIPGEAFCVFETNLEDKYKVK